MKEIMTPEFQTSINFRTSQKLTWPSSPRPEFGPLGPNPMPIGALGPKGPLPGPLGPRPGPLKKFEGGGAIRGGGGPC